MRRTARTAARLRAATTCAALALLALGSAPAHASTYPSSMDALGDSMTRAFNTGCPFYWTDCLENSWATGTSSRVGSYYIRLLKLNSGISGHNYNDAVSGAKMEALPGQAESAISRKVALVTILMGNNDACGGSSGVMTAVSTFESDFRSAMAKLAKGLPGASVRVASLPNAIQLWELFHTNSAAVSAWETFKECEALLHNPTSEAAEDVARRAAFKQREEEFNAVLRKVCAEYAQCRFDNGAGFASRFGTNDVSTADYFHPSVEGQALIAKVAWEALGY